MGGVPVNMTNPTEQGLKSDSDVGNTGNCSRQTKNPQEQGCSCALRRSAVAIVIHKNKD